MNKNTHKSHSTLDKSLIALVVILITGALLYQIPWVQNMVHQNDQTPRTPEVLAVESEIIEMKEQFLQYLADEDYTIPYTPGVVIENTPSLMFFSSYGDSGELFAPEWTTSPDHIKSLMNEWVDQADSIYTGEQFFKRNFNWFLVPHELAHFVQYTQPINFDNDDRWDGELNANKTAVAYFLAQGMEQELAEFVRETTKVMNLLGSPAPQGVDERQYFNDNYETLGDDPTKYGYYQFLLYKEAFDRRDELRSHVIQLEA